MNQGSKVVESKREVPKALAKHMDRTFFNVNSTVPADKQTERPWYLYAS